VREAQVEWWCFGDENVRLRRRRGGMKARVHHLEPFTNTKWRCEGQIAVRQLVFEEAMMVLKLTGQFSYLVVDC
jgi:hypothetical protein